MVPNLAAFVTWAFVFFLLIRDWRNSPKTSPGLWVATLWFLILATRAPHYWLAPTSGEIGVQAYEEGNSFNQAVYLGLIVSGMLVLWRRHVVWPEVIRRNRALLIFFAYTFLSAVWADNPIVSLKGSIKAVVGNLVMALVVLTDRNQIEAVKQMFRRLTYVAIPLSVMAIKYFPSIGRATHRWSYYTMYSGIAVGSNGLATLCYICGLITFSSLVQPGAFADRKNFGINLLLMGMVLWLMVKADGGTSNASLLLGVIVILCLRWNMRRPVLLLTRHIGIFLAIAAPIVVLNYGFFMDFVALLFGHSETLWGRLVVWQNAVSLADSPILGVGYNNFWQGERLAKMWEIYSWRPTQAHNGYVETYLNIGIVGIVSLLAAIVVSFGRASSTEVKREIQDLKLPYMLPILFYNLTEAAFRGLHPVWFAFLMLGLEARGQRKGESSPLKEPKPQPHQQGQQVAATPAAQPPRWGTSPRPGFGVARRMPFGQAPVTGKRF
jgi:O-antigen ligase